MESLPSHALCRMVKPMTEIELNARIDALLTENPVQQKAGQDRRLHRRAMKVHKDDRLLRIINRNYVPYAGYVDRGFNGQTLLHSGKYIKYPKNSNSQRRIKRLTSKRVRQCPELTGKGNQYCRLLGFWWALY